MSDLNPIVTGLRLGSKAPCEISISELIEEFSLDAKNILDSAVKVFEIVKNCDLELVPGLEFGDLVTTRVLRKKIVPAGSIDYVTKLISCGEGHSVEFKSSFLFDHKRYEFDTNNNTVSDLKNYQSAGVTHAALKTVAAFLNSDGGTLLIGVVDDGTIKGIEQDFPLCGADSSNGPDKWELHFKNLVTSRFLNGNAIPSYIRISLLKIEDKTVAIVEVTPRSRLSFLKTEKPNDPYSCYRRSGNSTVSVEIYEIEEFAEGRKAKTSSI